jgi:hypothetical protein
LGEKCPNNLAYNLRLCDGKLQGSLTCSKSATWGKWLYVPSEGRHAKDFFARKIRRLRPGAKPRFWVPEASMLTTRPPELHIKRDNLSHSLRSRHYVSKNRPFLNTCLCCSKIENQANKLLTNKVYLLPVDIYNLFKL